MNTRFLKTAGLLGMLGAFSLAANAQSPVARATVPFEFAAAGAMLPPGEYTVDAPDFTGVLVIHGTGGGSIALLTVASETATPSNTAKLIFERRDGMAYLAGVEWPNRSVRLTSPFVHVVKGAATAALR